MLIRRELRAFRVAVDGVILVLAITSLALHHLDWLWCEGPCVGETVPNEVTRLRVGGAQGFQDGAKVVFWCVGDLGDFGVDG